MDRARCIANKVIMRSYPYMVTWKVSHILPYMVIWKVKVIPYHIWSYERWKSYLTIYGHMKGESHTLPYMVTCTGTYHPMKPLYVRTKIYILILTRMFSFQWKNNHLLDVTKCETVCTIPAVSFMRDFSGEDSDSLNTKKLILWSFLLQVYLLCWVSCTLYLSIMALSVVTSWLHLRSSSSVEEQEVWGV